MDDDSKVFQVSANFRIDPRGDEYFSISIFENKFELIITIIYFLLEEENVWEEMEIQPPRFFQSYIPYIYIFFVNQQAEDHHNSSLIIQDEL